MASEGFQSIIKGGQAKHVQRLGYGTPTTALDLEEAAWAQGVQSIHGISVVCCYVLRQGAAICPRGSICIRLVHQVHNQMILQKDVTVARLGYARSGMAIACAFTHACCQVACMCRQLLCSSI